MLVIVQENDDMMVTWQYLWQDSVCDRTLSVTGQCLWQDIVCDRTVPAQILRLSQFIEALLDEY